MEPGLNTSNPTPYNRMLTPEVAGTPSNSDFTPGVLTFAASSPSVRRNFISQPPPPVPPIPPSLFPGLNNRGPSQAHQNLDLFFTRNSTTSPYSPTNSVASFPPPEDPNSPQSPYDHQSPTETVFTPPHVPPRPTTSYFSGVSCYGKFSHDLPRDPISAPPAVPPRPPIARVDQGFEASVSTRAPLMIKPVPPPPPPPLPPKILSSPGTSSIPSVPATFKAPFPTDRNLPSSASSSPYTPPPPLPPKPSVLVSSSQEGPLSRSSSQDLSTLPEHFRTTSQSASPHSPVVPLRGPLATPDRTSTPPSSPNDTPSSPSRPRPLLDIILPGVPHSQQPFPEPPLPDDPVEQDLPSTVPKDYQDNDDAKETSPVTPTSHLQRALTLSLEESAREGETEKQADVKDDELAWALAESLALSSKLEAAMSHRSDGLGFFTEASTSTAGTQLPAYTPSSNKASVNMNDSGESLLAIPDNDGPLSQELMDAELTRQLEIEDMARRLQEEESESLARELEEQEQTQLRREEQIRNDAEMVRRMQEEENRKIKEKRRAIRIQELYEQELKRLAGIEQQRDAEIARMMAGSQILAQQEAERVRQIQANESRLLQEERLKCERKANESAARKKALDEKAKRVIGKAQKEKEAEKARRKAGVQAQASQQAYQGPLTGGGTGHILATPPAYIDAIKPAQPHAPPIPPAQLPSPVDIPPVIQHVSRTRAASAKAVAPRTPSESLTRSSSVNSTAVRYHGTTARPVEQLREPSSSSATEVVAGPSSRVQTNTAASPQDQGVMQGISYGFKPPEVPFSGSQPRAVPPFPEVIHLFPAPSPPFHIMALSWKQLVRLLAQQESRVEVNLATIAGSKTNHHLRIIVRFLKFAHTDTWRTVIYLSLDEPVPANTPAAWRFKNGDTSVLPYSYAKGEELRPTDVMSQLYTIPLTPTSPFPILPITFPNIALYLQSAMRDSRARKAQNGSLARLARIAMECYPDEVIQEPEEKKQSGRVGNLLRRVVGRPERQESAGNEDVYDVITPFRVDEYVVSS